VEIAIPPTLAETCSHDPALGVWLEALPETVRELAARWSLTLEPPFQGKEISCSWVAPVTRADGSPAVLKLGMPHFEGARELDALRLCAGNPTVHLLEADIEGNAMLLERCLPGTVLRTLPEPEQDAVLAELLRRFWRAPPAGHPFRPLAEMAELWATETEDAEERWLDAGLTREGLALWRELPGSAPEGMLLATDLHAGNILRAEREPWLVIDPKPFVGDRHYDATQHLLNCERLATEPAALVRRMGQLLDLDEERVRLWTFARVTAELPWLTTQKGLAVARALAP
jgi:streptomycin 6-kinase